MEHEQGVWKGKSVRMQPRLEMTSSVDRRNDVKVKGKGHPCTGTEAVYRPYGP